MRMDAWGYWYGPQNPAEWLGLMEAHELISRADEVRQIESERHSKAARAFVATGRTYEEFVAIHGPNKY